MRQLIRESIGAPIVRSHAEAATAGVPPTRPLRELHAVYRYLADHVQYRRDPDEVEWLQAPWWVLYQVDLGRVPQLDCDDLTMLSLAMLGTIGFDGLSIRVVSTRQDQAFNHVYGLARVGDALVPVDLTRAWQRAAGPMLETRHWDLAV